MADLPTQQLRRAKVIFLEALDRPRREREQFASEAAGGDAAVRDEVLQLLASDEAADASDDFDRLTFTIDWSGLSDPPKSLLELTEGDVIDHYVLREFLGRGGHGEVWRADQTAPVQRTVALKLLGRQDERLQGRFDLERQALARLDHRDVARVLDAGVYRDQPYLVVELAPGRAIDRFATDESLSVRQRLELMVRVCDAVAHAHARGLLHCDLKPGNVLVWRDEREGDLRIKIIDFGIARLIEEESPDGIVGTPMFMSPEQARGERVDLPSDVYALGLILHTLLGGSNPIKGATMSRSRRAMAEAAAEAPRPEALPATIAAEGNWIVQRATQAEPTHRYATATEMADDLRRWLTDRPVRAASAGWTYRTRKLIKRHKAVAAALAATLLALIGGVVTTTTQAIRATEAERQALVDRDAALAAKAEADDNADAARATSRFLQRVLFSARPGFEQPEEQAAFVRSVDRARDGLKTDLLDRPETRSELLDMIGLIYFESGRLEEAQPLLEEAYELRKELFGDRDLRTLRSGEQLSSVLQWRKQYEASIELSEQIIATASEVEMPREEPILRNARTSLSQALVRRLAPGDLERLRELGREAIAALDASDVMEDERRHWHNQMLNYADGLISTGLYRTSESAGQELDTILDISRQQLVGREMGESRFTMQLYHLHARLLSSSGNWHEALLIYNELVPMMKLRLRRDNSLLLNARARHLTLRAIYETRDAKPEEVEALLDELRDLVALTKDRDLVLGVAPLQMVLWNAQKHEELREVLTTTIARGAETVHAPPGAFEQAGSMIRELREARPDLFPQSSSRPARLKR